MASYSCLHTGIHALLLVNMQICPLRDWTRCCSDLTHLSSSVGVISAFPWEGKNVTFGSRIPGFGLPDTQAGPWASCFVFLSLDDPTVNGDYDSCPVEMSQGPNKNALMSNSKRSGDVLAFLSFFFFPLSVCFFFFFFLIALYFYVFVVFKGNLFFIRF